MCTLRALFHGDGFVSLCLLGGLTIIPTVSQSQTVSGAVRDREGGAAVGSAQVTVLDTLGTVVTTVGAESKGEFRVTLEHHGVYRIRVSALGYAEALSDVFTLEPLESLQVDLWLSPEPIGLPALEVRSRRRPLMDNVMLQGFVERREKGWGRFLTRDQIEVRDAGTVAQVLGTVPGVTIVRHPNQAEHGGWYLIKFNRAAPSLSSLSMSPGCVIHPNTPDCVAKGVDPERLAQEYVSGGCPPVFYIDGGKVHDAGYVTEILNVTPPSHIEAIEVYRGASEMPAEFGGTDARCGVVVIWTRRGGQ